MRIWLNFNVATQAGDDVITSASDGFCHTWHILSRENENISLLGGCGGPDRPIDTYIWVRCLGRVALGDLPCVQVACGPVFNILIEPRTA